MKSIRTMFLFFAVTVVPFAVQRAFAQQEVDPDHFDHPTVATPAAVAHANQATGHHARGNSNLASKHASNPSNTPPRKGESANTGASDGRQSNQLTADACLQDPNGHETQTCTLSGKLAGAR